jgi:hypothetical protein
VNERCRKKLCAPPLPPASCVFVLTSCSRSSATWPAIFAANISPTAARSQFHYHFIVVVFVAYPVFHQTASAPSCQGVFSHFCFFGFLTFIRCYSLTTVFSSLPPRSSHSPAAHQSLTHSPSVTHSHQSVSRRLEVGARARFLVRVRAVVPVPPLAKGIAVPRHLTAGLTQQ